MMAILRTHRVCKDCETAARIRSNLETLDEATVDNHLLVWHAALDDEQGMGGLVGRGM
jgi:hypothetical protein